MNSYEIIKVSNAEVTCWRMNDILKPAYAVTMIAEIDATNIDEMRASQKSTEGSTPSYTAIVIKAAALTLKRNPEGNRAILGLPFLKKLVQFKNFDISIAVEKNLPNLPGQALAETVRNPLNKTLGEITSELRGFAECTEETNERWRLFMRILRYIPSPISNLLINIPYYFPKMWVKHRGCACWVNSPSRHGADITHTTWFWPITFSFGLIKERPIAINGNLQVRRTIPLVMVFDRRTMNGGPAARIFAQFKTILEEADSELSSY